MSFQIWLPLPDEVDSVRTLNKSHLGGLRYHVLELMETFHAIPEGSSMLPSDYERHPLVEADHPILDQFVGYETWLANYGLIACDEWQLRRGKRDPLYEMISTHLEISVGEDSQMGRPNWFGDIDFHLAQQAALLREDETHYKSYFMTGNDRSLIVPRSDHA